MDPEKTQREVGCSNHLGNARNDDSGIHYGSRCFARVSVLGMQGWTALRATYGDEAFSRNGETAGAGHSTERNPPPERGMTNYPLSRLRYCMAGTPVTDVNCRWKYL